MSKGNALTWLCAVLLLLLFKRLRFLQPVALLPLSDRFAHAMLFRQLPLVLAVHVIAAATQINILK